MSISCACLSLAPLPHLNTSPYVPPFLHLFVEAPLPSCLKLAFNELSKLVGFCHIDLPLQSQLRNLQHGSSASVANSFSSLSFGEVENGQALQHRGCLPGQRNVFATNALSCSRFGSWHFALVDLYWLCFITLAWEVFFHKTNLRPSGVLPGRYKGCP